MAIGDIITATRYNNLQTRVENILGNGSGTEGYGQTTASNQVPVGNIVQASHMNNLYNDFDKIYRHQVNLSPSASLNTLAVEDLIAEATSDNPNGVLKGYADYESFAGTIESDPNRFRLHSLQRSVDTEALVTPGTSTWRNTATLTVFANFTSSDARRHFFNSGGNITFIVTGTSSASGGNVSKTNNWVTMLSNSGTVSFDHNSTASDNSGTGTSIGNYQVTSSEQTIYTKSGSSIYSGNTYQLRVREESSTQLRFRIVLTDSDSGTAPFGPNNAKGFRPIDEYFQGTVNADTGFIRASGAYVDVAAPTFSLINGNQGWAFT